MANGIQEVDQEMFGTIKRHAGLGMAVGILTVIAGFLALVAPLVAGLSIAIAVGVLLILAGVSRLFLAFRMGSFGHGLLVFVIGLLSIVAGGYMLGRPGMALATLTIFLAAYFVVEGAFEIIWAFRLRPIKGWGWTLFSGIVALALGIMIWRQFPVSGVWAVGTLVGVSLIFGGASLASVCGAARSAAKEAQAA
ncbi:MAG TPA: HdeD family acid-resistance protein [Polyangiales bacterium]|nr:HdeD family acid-resistance protein [Polyangiales bacterium]